MPVAIRTFRNRLLTIALGVAIATVGLTLSHEKPATASPVASNASSYAACGRVFPDPHAYWPSPAQGPNLSPWAKGNASCQASEYMTYAEMIAGNAFLEGLMPDFVEFYELETDFGNGTNCQSAAANNLDYCSAGLAQSGGGRLKQDLYLLRITDERVPDADKKFFAYPLSIHGIERAGAEGGTRAAEDLATWAYCEAVANGETVTPPVSGTVNCANEDPIPHPILETQPTTSLSAGAALKQSVIYMVYANADGWVRGDPPNTPRWFQRYNGNSVDMNRDWPTIGYTFRPFTPWSEPETRAFGQVLKTIKPKWDGGIDLHGQLTGVAFSYTMLGASQRDYAKDQRILQTVKGAWEDAEARYAWNTALIKPNDAPADDPRMYGVQWGTVWDTIAYTTTGSFGDWIDSPLGLGADGIDNEMSLSHISNCGNGTCYIKDAEQLHIDGNKSLIYAQVNYTLLPEDTSFDAPGKVGYVQDDTRLVNPGTSATQNPHAGLPTQPDEAGQLNVANDFIYEFEVKGPQEGFYNGGLEGVTTPANLSGFSLSATAGTTAIILERRRLDTEPPGAPDEGCSDPNNEWIEVNRFFDQNQLYFSSGQAVHANQPLPGEWRICLRGGLEEGALSGGFVDVDVKFLAEQAIEDPGQLPYDVSNMDFFKELAPYMKPGQLNAVSPESVLNGSAKLSQYDSLVIADDPFPGFSEPAPSGPAQDPVSFARPGAGTVPCAYQPGTQDALPATCFTSHEFDVEPGFNNQSFTWKLDGGSVGDWDTYVERQSRITGEWFQVADAATGSPSETGTLLQPPIGHYRVKVVNWSSSPSGANSLEVTFDNAYVGPPIEPSTRTQAEMNKWAKELEEYVRGGGNLVLTDGAIRNLAFMGMVDRSIINNFASYAGFIGFTRDGTTSTFEDTLGQNVNQPGAAEGPQFRHQTYEPVPIGFAIMDEDGADYNGSPIWAVDQVEWEKLGGRTVGLSTADQVTLGEMALGKGQVRIIGALIPMPTEQYYHPFGLASYAVTYTGYQVFNNALQVPGGSPEIEVLSGCNRLLNLKNINKLFGTKGKDGLRGTNEPDAICGGPGKDTIKGLKGSDILIGGKSNDRVTGAGGNDKLFLGAGNDVGTGGSGKDRIVGYKGNDLLNGGGGHDSINGQSGTDSCAAGEKVRRCER